MSEPILYPWRTLDENGKLERWLDNGPVWEPGGVPIWRSRQAAAWRKGVTPVPWPITGTA